MIDDVTLWQQVLAGEHAAIWAYGLVGATAQLAPTGDAALRTHRARRTRCSDEVLALGGQPVTSAPAYDVARPANEADARTLAADLEQGCAVGYAALAGADDRRARLVAARWLRESAIDAWQWDGEVPVLPGLAEPT